MRREQKKALRAEGNKNKKGLTTGERPQHEAVAKLHNHNKHEQGQTLRVLSKGFVIGFHRYLDTLSSLEEGGFFGLKDPTISLFPNAPPEATNIYLLHGWGINAHCLLPSNI
jgi:hypothetical protein